MRLFGMRFVMRPDIMNIGIIKLRCKSWSRLLLAFVYTRLSVLCLADRKFVLISYV